jgi:hypothetical protein
MKVAHKENETLSQNSPSLKTNPEYTLSSFGIKSQKAKGPNEERKQSSRVQRSVE